MESAQSGNLILAGLPPADFILLRPHLRMDALPLGLTLINAGEIPTRAYFPHSGVVASTLLLKSGHRVEVRITGREGAIGTAAGSGQHRSFTSAIVRIQGQSSSIDFPSLDIATERSLSLRTALAKHNASQQAMADQTIACNAIHDVQARLARRLLRLFAMSGQNKFTVTQEVLAEMLAVRRNAVSLAAHSMLNDNVITYSRGVVEVVDINRLRHLSCECYDTVSSYRSALGDD
jgi:CRP-like cAMP-binding protein